MWFRPALRLPQAAEPNLRNQGAVSLVNRGIHPRNAQSDHAHKKQSLSFVEGNSFEGVVHLIPDGPWHCEPRDHWQRAHSHDGFESEALSYAGVCVYAEGNREETRRL